MEQQVEIEAQIHLEDGMYWAEVPSYPGLFASGETLDELTEALVEAWLLYATDSLTDVRIEPVKRPLAQGKKKRGVKAAVQVDQLRLLVPA
jgi:predicted RNase H-like HicB family nuclease